MPLERIVIMNRITNSRFYRWVVVVAALITMGAGAFSAYEVYQKKNLLG